MIFPSSAWRRLIVFFALLGGGQSLSWAAAELVSVTTGNEINTNGPCVNGSVDAAGRFVVFNSASSKFAPPDFAGLQDVFLRDRALGLTTRISKSANANEPDGDSISPVISADGQWIAFESTASNLVASDTNGQSDVFLCDRSSGQIRKVSVGMGGAPASGGSSRCAISANGRFVAFVSSADNLVPNDTNGIEDVFVRDVQAGTTTRVNVSSAGVESPAGTFVGIVQLSYDGRWVVFSSTAANLVSGHTGVSQDVFLHDRTNRTTILVSETAAGVQGNGDSYDPTISGDGSTVAFVSNATNLVGAVGGPHVAIKDRLTGAVSRPRPAATYSFSASLSADGSRVALASKVGGGSEEIEVIDRRSGAIFKPSRTASGVYTPGGSQPVLSGDGRVVVFSSFSGEIVTGDNNFEVDVFARPLADTIGFTQHVFHGTEGSSVEIEVRRDGLVGGAISVSYKVGNATDSAERDVDYTVLFSSGTFTWTENDFSPRTLTFPLNDDPDADGPRVFTMALSSPSSGAVLGTKTTAVAIRDNDSDPVENHIGHGLKISSIVSRGTNWDTGVFRALITVTNPSAFPSFPGFIDLQFEGVSINTPAIGGIPAGGSITLDVSSGVGDEPDGKVYAILSEITDDGAIVQDSALAAGFINNGTQPPSGGTAAPNLGAKAPGFTPVTLKSVTVNGAANVNEGTNATYTVTAKLSDGTTIPNVAPVWKTSLFLITQDGQFFAGDVAADKAVKISATVTKNGVTVTGSKTVTVKNVPAVPIITSALLKQGTTGKPFSYRITARHEPTLFATTALPDGLVLNAATGVISGVPTTSGQSSVQIEASNAQGADTETLVIKIADPSPITINIVGDGITVPITHGQILEVGKFYKVTAKPNAGFLFAGWSGAVNTSAAAILFEMAQNLSLTATFVENPFLTRAGNYACIFTGTPGGHEGCGLLLATVSKTGVCSGKLTLGGKIYPFKLTLPPNGAVNGVSIPRKNRDPLIVLLSIVTGNPQGELQGNVVSGFAFNADILAHRATTDAGAAAGACTAIFPSPEEPSIGGERPDGSGYATAKIKPNGRATLAGKLGDGSPIATGGFITESAEWNVYAPLYGKKGSILGAMTVASNPVSDFSGTLLWFKPARPADAFYPDGWPAGIQAPVFGALYSAPPVFPGLAAPNANGNAFAMLVGGGLPGSITQTLNIADNGSVTPVQPIRPGFAFRINAANGLFSGGIADPISGKIRKFTGALQQKFGGVGFFFGSGKRTGNVILAQ